MSSGNEPSQCFNAFLCAANRWECDAYIRSQASKGKMTVQEFYEATVKELKAWLPEFCTAKCVDRIQQLDGLDSGGSYGTDGGKIVSYEVTGKKARIETQGTNNYPDSERRHVYVLVLEDGQWKIDSKKEISESGRERKVDLF